MAILLANFGAKNWTDFFIKRAFEITQKVDHPSVTAQARYLCANAQEFIWEKYLSQRRALHCFCS